MHQYDARREVNSAHAVYRPVAGRQTPVRERTRERSAGALAARGGKGVNLPGGALETFVRYVWAAIDEQFGIEPMLSCGSQLCLTDEGVPAWPSFARVAS